MTEKLTERQWRPEGNCTIYEAQQLSETLQQILQSNVSVSIDISAIEQVDASFLQLLIAARSEAAARGVQLRVEGSAPAVERLAQNIHCKSALYGDPKSEGTEAVAHESR